MHLVKLVDTKIPHALADDCPSNKKQLLSVLYCCSFVFFWFRVFLCMAFVLLFFSFFFKWCMAFVIGANHSLLYLFPLLKQNFKTYKNLKIKNNNIYLLIHCNINKITKPFHSIYYTTSKNRETNILTIYTHYSTPFGSVIQFV